MWQVLVGNTGKVHSSGEAEARKAYRLYVLWSIQGLGRAAHEPVTLMQEGEIKAEHDPYNPKVEHTCLALGDSWSPDGVRARKGRVTVWHSKRGYLAEYSGQPLLATGDTPQEAHERLQGQLQALVEQLKEAL